MVLLSKENVFLLNRVIFRWMGLQVFSEIAVVEIFGYWHKVLYRFSKNLEPTHHSATKVSMAIYLFLFHLNFQIIEVSANKIPLSSRWKIILWIKQHHAVPPMESFDSERKL